MVVTKSEDTPGHGHYFGTTAICTYKKPFKNNLNYLNICCFPLYYNQELTISGLFNDLMKQAI